MKQNWSSLRRDFNIDSSMGLAEREVLSGDVSVGVGYSPELQLVLPSDHTDDLVGSELTRYKLGLLENLSVISAKCVLSRNYLRKDNFWSQAPSPPEFLRTLRILSRKGLCRPRGLG